MIHLAAENDPFDSGKMTNLSHENGWKMTNFSHREMGRCPENGSVSGEMGGKWIGPGKIGGIMGGKMTHLIPENDAFASGKWVGK